MYSRQIFAKKLILKKVSSQYKVGSIVQMYQFSLNLSPIQQEFSLTPNGPRREKTCLRGFANNTGADQPAHPRSLISAFVIRFFESIICKLAAGEISIF